MANQVLNGNVKASYKSAVHYVMGMLIICKDYLDQNSIRNTTEKIFGEGRGITFPF